MSKNEEIKKPTGAPELEDDSSISESEETITAEWMGKLLKARPEIVQMRERSRPLIGETSYGRKIGSSTTESPLVLSHRTVGQLVLGYLQEKGFQKSLEKIEIETSFKLQKNMIREDGKLLEKMLHTGISDVSTLFDPALSSLDEEGGMGEGEVGWFDYQPSTYDDQDNNEEDINIWDTPRDKDIVLEPSIDDKKVSVVVLCTFNSIVQFITSSNPGNIPMRNAFLTTYRSFTTPDKLFDKLLQRYEVTGELLDDPQYVKQIRMRVVLVLKHWMSTHPRDFSDRLLSKVREFTENRLIRDGHQEFSKTLTNPLSKLTEKEGWGGGYEPEFDLCPDPKVPKNIFSPTLKLDDIPKLEIARQMTLIDYHLFASISAVEFCNKNWTKVKNSRSSPLIAMINRFNEVLTKEYKKQIVKWVTTSILSEKRYKNRAKIIQNYLEIAVSLQGLQNFHSLAAIFTGITHGSVFRLKHTFNELSPMARKNISSISSFLSPNESYKHYKSFISSVKPPAIPHIAVNLQDLCFIDEIVPDKVNGKINFRKHRIIYNLIDKDIRRFQPIGYNFLPILQISLLLKGFTNLIKDEADLYKCSLVLEPKGISAIDLVDYEEQLNSSSPSV